jgi:hypothetical protein
MICCLYLLLMVYDHLWNGQTKAINCWRTECPPCSDKHLWWDEGFPLWMSTSVPKECIRQNILPIALACGMIDGQQHTCIAHDTEICHNPQIHYFMENKKKHDILNRTTHKHLILLAIIVTVSQRISLTLLWKYREKHLLCGHNILTEGAFVIPVRERIISHPSFYRALHIILLAVILIEDILCFISYDCNRKYSSTKQFYYVNNKLCCCKSTFIWKQNLFFNTIVML